MNRFKLTGAFALLALFMSATSVMAEPYRTNVHGREVIVHKNPVPVVVHRLLPPYWNKHVTERELKTGQLPTVRSR